MRTPAGQTEFETLCKRLASRYSFEGFVDKLLAEIAKTTKACKARTLSLAEVEKLAEAQFNVGYAILQELHTGNYYGYRIGPNLFRKQEHRLVVACLDFKHRFQKRKVDESPAAKLAEAQLSARQAAVGTQEHEFMDFPKILGAVRRASSQLVDDYRNEDVGAPPEKFLDVIEILADNGAQRAQVSSAADIREALARAETGRKWEQTRWERFLVGDEILNISDKDVWDAILMNIDKSRSEPDATVDRSDRSLPSLPRLIADVKLPPDQARVLEAAMDGLNLQGSEAAASLGWTHARLERARRSLEPDRRWGRALRDHPSIAAYAASKNRLK